MPLSIRLPTLAASQALPRRRRDVLWRGDTDGSAFGFDLGFPWSFPAQAAPAIDTAIVDTAEVGNGRVALSAGQALPFTGGGLDFSGITANGQYVEAPAAASSVLWGAGAGATATASVTGTAVTGIAVTNGGGGYKDGAEAIFTGGGVTGGGEAVNCTVVGGVVTAIPLPAKAYTGVPTITIVPKQTWMISAALRLPALADWISGSEVAAVIAMNGYNQQVTGDICNILFAPGGVFQTRRQAGSGSATSSSLAPPSYGDLALVSAFRSATDSGLLISTPAGTARGLSGAPGLPTPVNFSAQKLRFGAAVFWNPALPAQANARKFRLYAGSAMNLRNGFDPVAAHTKQFERLLARKAASAAANGGSSRILN